MKRKLLIASVVGLLLLSAVDLQARHGRRRPPRVFRAGIALSMTGYAALPFHGQGIAPRSYRNGRQVAREIRRNEKRIWKLERRVGRLERRRGNRREILRLEWEIRSLQRRNAYLRSLCR